MSSRTKAPQHRGVTVGAIAVVVLVVAGIAAWWGPTLVHAVAGQERALWVVGFASIAIAGAACLRLFSIDSKNRQVDTSGTRMAIAVGTSVALSLGAFAYLATSGYYRAHIYNEDAMTVVEEQVPDYADRVPYDVALSTASRNLQNTTGDLKSPKFLADAGTNGEWNALITRRGFATGYESVQVSQIPNYGLGQAKDVSFCQFPEGEQMQWNGGMWWNSLKRSLYSQTSPSVRVSDGSVYAYCQGDTPVVVMPLQRTEGFWVTHEVPFGVATYSDGKIQILTDSADIAEIPGPTNPQDLVAAQRKALAATGSLWDYVFDRSGWYASDSDGGSTQVDSEGKETTRYNNPSEIQLSRENGGSDFVTPLTPPGSSESIVGVSVSNAKMTTPGKLEPIVVHTYANGNTRSANSAVSDNIKSQYSTLSAWANGMQVYEIVPQADGNWVASIGQQQSVVYRAIITREGTITLHTATGVVSEGASGATNADDGSVVGSVSTGVDVSSLTDEELTQLIKDAADELASR